MSDPVTELLKAHLRQLRLPAMGRGAGEAVARGGRLRPEL